MQQNTIIMNVLAKKKWLAIGLFYLIAVVVRYVALNIAHDIENPSFTDLSIWPVAWAEGVGPCLGAIIVVLLFKRDFYCSITGSSLIKSAISLLIPFAVCFILHHELSFILLGFIFYSFLEEVGWRGYLQGELKDKSLFVQSLVIGTMWLLWHIQIGLNLGTLIFWLLLVFGSWGIGKIATDTHSLVLCACFHTLYNFSSHGMFHFTPSVIALYVAVIASWFVIWYLPWGRWFGKNDSKTVH